ncbi:putative defense protein 3 [Planococcus citri]|uniref:putative defense protein 3 n=1 Tax=Planococcus citri TaxID=170843 RepID=UPI0031FA3E04
MFKVSALSFVLLILVDLYYGFETGAPEGVCVDMKPKHLNAKPQLPPSPYKISVSKFSIGSSEKIDVTIEGTEVFKGFLLQCRNSQGVPVGKFESHPSGQTLNCAPGKDNALTHRNATDKYSLVFKWKPAGFKGTAVCIGTVVKSAPIFWTQLKSPQFEVV